MIKCPHCGEESNKEEWNENTHLDREIRTMCGVRDIVESLNKKRIGDWFRCPKCDWASMVESILKFYDDDSKYFFLEYGGG